MDSYSYSGRNGSAIMNGNVSGTTRTTRLMIVDDHPIVRRGLKLALLSSPDFEVVGEAATGEDAIELLEQVQPDVVLMDLVMPGMGGVNAIRGIHDVAPEVKVIVFSHCEEGVQVREALQAGAIGYLLKDIEIDNLFAAMREAASGIASLAPAAARSLVRLAKVAPKLGDDLTEREREVLALLVEGRSNESIAVGLVITPATVKFHLRNIRSKLGTTSRTETVVVALRHQLVPSQMGAEDRV
jgi:DNA-binding NarL/FixJ family response regulator